MTNIKRELKNLIPIAVPAIFFQLAQMAMGVIDTLMSGHYSNEALAAIAVAVGLLYPAVIFFLGLFLALNPIIAQLNGAESYQAIGRHFRFGLVLAIVLSPVTILILFNIPMLFQYLNIDEKIAEIATGYLHAINWGIPGLLLFFAVRFFNEGMFATKPILFVTLASIPLNVLLNYWFMYGGFGLKEMGAVGLGYATSLVWTFMFVSLLIYTLITSRYAHLDLFKTRILTNFSEIKSFFNLGLPLASTLTFEVAMFAVVALMIAEYPTAMIGAHQIAMNIASVFFMIPMGMSQAISARVGYFIGKKDFQASRLAGYTGISTSLIFSLFSASIMIMFASVLVGAYTQDDQIQEIAIGLLFFAAVFQLSDGLQVTTAGALRGIKDTQIPMVITAISYWLVGFPIGYYLAEVEELKANGYWMGIIAGLTSAAILLMWRWIKLSKRFAKDNSPLPSLN